MTDKAKEGKKEEGCCGGTAKASTSTGCCGGSEKTVAAPVAQADSKAQKGGCGCA